MVHIVVKRGAGANPGEEIVDPLLSTVPAALSRGRGELDRQASGEQEVTLTVPFVAGRREGQIEAVHDILAGRVFKGKITGLRHRSGSGEAPAAWTDVTLAVTSEVFA